MSRETADCFAPRLLMGRQKSSERHPAAVGTTQTVSEKLLGHKERSGW